MPTKPWMSNLIAAAAIVGSSAIFALVLLYPWTVALSGPELRKPLFALMVISAGLGYAYGLGFRAEKGVLRFVLSPITVFTLIALALGWILYALSVGHTQL